MVTRSVVGIGCPVSGPDDTSRRLRRLLVAVPAVVLLGGAAALARDPRLGLLAAAPILGWTQLGGL